jgi:hypothetical protein
MAENERRIGDFGEDAASKLFKRIGWGDGIIPQDIKCFDESHLNTNGNPRSKHGLDWATSFQSVLVDQQRDVVMASVKFQRDGYSGEKSKFKGYMSDISEALSCFRFSESLAQLIPADELYSHSYKGLLVWLNNSDDQSVLAENTIGSRGLEISHPIAIIDNRRFTFVWESLNFADTRAGDQSGLWEFAIHATGHNHHLNDGMIKILPYELLVGGPIVFRVISANERTMIVSCPENFTLHRLNSMLQLSAEHSGRGWASRIEIVFPDYRKLVHERTASAATNRVSQELSGIPISVSSSKANPLTN